MRNLEMVYWFKVYLYIMRGRLSPVMVEIVHIY